VCACFESRLLLVGVQGGNGGAEDEGRQSQQREASVKVRKLPALPAATDSDTTTDGATTPSSGDENPVANTSTSATTTTTASEAAAPAHTALIGAMSSTDSAGDAAELLPLAPSVGGSDQTRTTPAAVAKPKRRKKRKIKRAAPAAVAAPTAAAALTVANLGGLPEENVLTSWSKLGSTVRPNMSGLATRAKGVKTYLFGSSGDRRRAGAGVDSGHDDLAEPALPVTVATQTMLTLECLATTIEDEEGTVSNTELLGLVAQCQDQMTKLEAATSIQMARAAAQIVRSADLVLVLRCFCARSLVSNPVRCLSVIVVACMHLSLLVFNCRCLAAIVVACLQLSLLGSPASSSSMLLHE
jgi:hypothetical protein